MPKRIAYIQCDCEKGKLERIAETDVAPGNSFHQDMRYTTFYSCNVCDRIFTRARIKHYNEGYRAHDAWKSLGFIPYAGKLTREEIMRFAPQYKGGINEHKEKKITQKINKLGKN